VAYIRIVNEGTAFAVRGQLSSRYVSQALDDGLFKNTLAADAHYVLKSKSRLPFYQIH
jgi:hypothetical protein